MTRPTINDLDRRQTTSDQRPATNDQRPMTIAWFSPLPPVRSGVAAYSAELLPHLERTFTIDRVDQARAHDFVWRHRRAPYDLIVYQLGNAVAGLGGPIYYFWSMLRVVMRTARLVAVHNDRVAAELGDSFPGTAIE